MREAAREQEFAEGADEEAVQVVGNRLAFLEAFPNLGERALGDALRPAELLGVEREHRFRLQEAHGQRPRAGGAEPQTGPGEYVAAVGPLHEEPEPREGIIALLDPVEEHKGIPRGDLGPAENG